ncbi:MAG TPA: AzlC family ABC transporter permease [Steroidobacteraceae bacterium]|nr:AzlC family ABC transporter permease [Steroidobacteraceae bacterium]
MLFTKAGVMEGVRECFPIALSVLPWGFAFGVASQPLVSFPKGLVMSAYICSGTAQFVALGMWHHPIAIASLLLAVFAINARYLLQGMTLAPWMNQIPAWQRWGTLFFLSDGCWAASIKRFENGYRDVGHLFGGCIIVYIAWLVSTVSGLLLPAERVDAKAWGLDFAISAALIAFAGARWNGRSSLLPWTVAIAAALISLRIFGGSWYMLIGGIAGAVAGAVNDDRNDA